MSTFVPSSPHENQPVLVADADQENVVYLEKQLRRAGVKNPVMGFGNGDDLHAFLAEAATTAGDTKPCVLFLDPRMPGANGYDPVRWVRRESSLSDMKVVIFSSTNYPEEIESAGDLGVHLFLKKHPDLSSLSLIVDHLCGVKPPERSIGESLKTAPHEA